MSVDFKSITSNELTPELIDSLVTARESFTVLAVTNTAAVASEIEGRIEKAGLSCRVYTEYRGAAIAGSLWGPTALLGIAAGIGIAAHNLATRNPDYEIGKNKVTGRVTVAYKKQ